MFRGISNLSIDAKGRMAMPSKYRERLSAENVGDMILTISPDLCLLLFPMPEWDLVEKKLQSLPSFDPQSKAVRRLYLNHASEVKLDSGGRILIPSMLRQHAKLQKKAVLAGQGNKFELWSEEVWAQESAKLVSEVQSIDYATANQALKELSI